MFGNFQIGPYFLLIVSMMMTVLLLDICLIYCADYSICPSAVRQLIVFERENHGNRFFFETKSDMDHSFYP